MTEENRQQRFTRLLDSLADRLGARFQIEHVQLPGITSLGVGVIVHRTSQTTEPATHLSADGNNLVITGMRVKTTQVSAFAFSNAQVVNLGPESTTFTRLPGNDELITYAGPLNFFTAERSKSAMT